MIAITCQHQNRRSYGQTKAGTLRYKCRDCGKSFTPSTELLGGMRIGLDRAAQIIEMLCEGMSIRSIVRLTDTHLQTITDLLVMVGERCEAFMADNIRGVQADDVQIDEIWQYVFCKARTAVEKKYIGDCGDSWCFTAVERTSKLLVTWHHGRRGQDDTDQFTRKLATATTGRFHLSSDGYGTYDRAVRWSLGQRVDYGQVIKIFGNEPGKDSARKYSPGRIVSSRREAVLGNPDMDRTCTSHVERLNGSIRHFTKRMARLTCAFSKRWDNHRAALALFFCHYNYCRKHRSLKGQTPAMAHGLTTEVWTVKELLQRVLST